MITLFTDEMLPPSKENSPSIIQACPSIILRGTIQLSGKDWKADSCS